ncbi:uncharacterized protein LOC142606239 [Castanea sativa]|uniref:uncharacterized protein LOC142606239 n=1 Tax=Castanea sativa TaxID=21020 RepID=UPI003F653AC9
MDHIDKYKRVEEDQQLGKGKAKVVSQDRRDFRSDKYNNNCHRQDFARQFGTAAAQLRVLVDQGSGVEITYPDVYKGLKLKLEDLACDDSPLVGFDGKVVVPMGQIRLLVQAGSEVVEVDFIVVDAYSPYTAIMVRPWLHAMGAISSTLHRKVKYPSGDRVEKVVGSQSMARQCLVAAIRHQIGMEAQLPPWEKEKLIVFLRKNIDVFAWSAYETPRVDPNFICHYLNVNPAIMPKKQLPRRSSKEYSEAIKEEVIKLKQARAIKEVFYPE